MVSIFDKLSMFGVNSHTARALMNNLWPQHDSLETTVTFAGGTPNAIGDFDGSGNPVTLFSVTGTVELVIIAVCETTLTGANATIELGSAINTAALIAQATGTDLDINQIWHDATPDASIELSSVAKRNIVNQDVILTVGTANATAGKIRFMCFWNPMSADGKVEVA